MPFIAALALAALGAAAPSPDADLARYAKPAEMIDIGGRRIDLRCSGTGSPTVLLEAGAKADSLAWIRVQPLIAKTRRVCSYDRAGYGFSDEGPLPRDVDADAADLDALLRAAHVGMPIVLVGHSLGSNIVRRYAERHPRDVAGIVLVDPWPQHISEFSPEWVKTDNEMRAGMLAFASKCAKAAEADQLARPPRGLEQCIRAGDPAYPEALNAAIHAQKEKPAFWRTLISESQANIELFEEPVSPKESHGAIPLIVLTADNTFDDAPPEGKKALEAARQETHKRLAATSTRGERRWIAHSTHEMPTDQPQAIAAAVADVVRASKAAK